MLDTPRRGGSHEHPQPMFSIKNEKRLYKPVYPELYDIRFKGVCFLDV